MALIVKTLPGVYGGVSNQTESLRKDNQVTEMINCNPSLVLGTTRRPNVEEGLVDIPSDSSFIYDYSRSTGESHILTVSQNGVITAHTIGEGEKSISVPQEVSEYLMHTKATALSGITIGDTTYLVNSEKIVGISQESTENMPELDYLYKSTAGDVEVHAENIAYYWLSRSSNDVDHTYRYVVELDGTQYEADSDKSEYAARALANKIMYTSEVCNIVSTKADAQDDYFDVEIRTGSIVGEGDLIDIDGFTWNSIDGFNYSSNGDGALTWTNQKDSEGDDIVGKYTVTVNTANSEDPTSYLLNIGEQEFTVVTEIDAADVASSFTNQLNEFIGSLVTPTRNASGFRTEANGSLIKIWKYGFENFTFNYWDSWGSMASFGWKYDVPKLQDLPSNFPWDGAVVRINSSDGYDQTSYYAIRWNDTWQEFTNRATYQVTSTIYTHDGYYLYSTYDRYLPMMNNLPIVITRLSDGNFEARLLNTSDQLKPPLVGNEDNNKDPYFVGKTIQQLFYINGRICIVSGDALTFSEVDVLWNFYSTTIISVLDGDTIEVKIASERVLEILKVAIFQSGLLIMTSEGQYLFNTEQGITPMNIIVNKLSNYSYNNDGGTIYDGDSIVFSGTTGDTARLYRYRVARLTSENKAIDLTIQVPTYIKGTVQQIVNYVEDGTLIVRVNNSKKLYLYREVISGDQMVQSSWYSWDFSNILINDILHIMVINDYLYFVSVDGVYKIPLGTKVFDSDFQHLDLGTTPYESKIVLTKWRPKKTNAQVQTNRGRVQLRTIGVSLDGKASLDIFKEDRGLTITKGITNGRQINVLSDTNKTTLSIINNGESPFTISAITLSGTYREKGKEII